MLTPRTTLARRVTAALDASPSRIPVVLGGCGSGRTTLLQQLRDRIGRTDAQYIDVERTATTPERFLRAVTAMSVFPVVEAATTAGGARAAFGATVALLDGAKAGGSGPATFLLDEFLELRTFESFPGLRRVLYDFADGIAVSGNRFVLTSRYIARTLRLLRDRSARFEVIHMPALTVEDTLEILALAGVVERRGESVPPDAPPTLAEQEAENLARAVQSLADGRPLYVRALADQLATMREAGAARAAGLGSSEAVAALVALFMPDARLARQCAFSYELRLHRARGYGALKAILEILAEEEGLTLTEISHRLLRTPGSTKDYLSWLEDVDLVMSRQKRYLYADPVLRLWVGLYCRPTAPSPDDVAREVHRYAVPRLPPRVELPKAEPAFAMVGGAPTGIIEID